MNARCFNHPPHSNYPLAPDSDIQADLVAAAVAVAAVGADVWVLPDIAPVALGFVSVEEILGKIHYLNNTFKTLSAN